MAEWQAHLNMIPEHCRAGIEHWIAEGIVPGSFLRAVLSNNLKETYMCADHINEQYIRNYVSYLYQYAPSECWGSIEKMRLWASHNGLKGTD